MPASGIPALFLRILALLERIPFAIAPLLMRFGMGLVFWRSAQTKLANWDTTLLLFREEYRVPLLPPERSHICIAFGSWLWAQSAAGSGVGAAAAALSEGCSAG